MRESQSSQPLASVKTPKRPKARFIEMATLDISSSIHQPPLGQPVSEVRADLKTNLQTGLASDEVQNRHKLYGLNALRSNHRTPLWRRLLAQFHDPQVYLLLGASAVAILVSKLEGESGFPLKR
jgi:Ca2+-transporting ATPase